MNNTQQQKKKNDYRQYNDSSGGLKPNFEIQF